MNKTIKPYGHMGQKNNLPLKKYFACSNHGKSLPYTKAQLDVEGNGIKSFSKNV